MGPGSTFSLITCNGQYVTFANEILGANQRTIGPTEIFSFELTPDGWMIQTSFKHYVSINGGGPNSLSSVNGPPPYPWGLFQLVDVGNGCFALKAANGKYVSAEGGGGKNLTANRDAIGDWETFGFVDASVPYPTAKVSPPGAPLIATCILKGGTNYLLQYNPATGDLYRSRILDNGLDTPVLTNRGNPCDRGCTQIVAASRSKSTPYVITYRRSDGKASCYRMNDDGVLEAGATVTYWPQDYVRLIPVADLTWDYQIFAYREGGGPIDRYAYYFDPRYPFHFLRAGTDSESFWAKDTDGSQHTQVFLAGESHMLRYRGTTGEALQSFLYSAGMLNSRWLGMCERNWEQIVSYVDGNGAGHVICLPASSSELRIYRTTGSGLDQRITCPLPTLRPPPVRLHAIQTQQLLELPNSGSPQLRPDNLIGFDSELEILPDASGAFRMRSFSNQLLCVAADGTFSTTADGNRDATSLFRMEPQPGACFRLRTASGTYAFVDPQDGLIKANTDEQIQLQNARARSVFEWNDYGVGGGNTYLDQILGQVAFPPALSALAQVHSEYNAAANAYCFSTRSANEAAAAGYQLQEILFYGELSQLPGTVPVYLEQRVDGQPGYHLSIRDAATAAQWGWRQLGIVCYAYATQQPGTVPVYRESPPGVPSSQFYFSTRSAVRAAAAGFVQTDVAFYAYAPLVPVHSDFSPDCDRYDFSTRNASELAAVKYKARETLFYAYDQPSRGAVPVYLEQRVTGERGYHLATRDAATAAQWGWKQLGIAFYAYATPQPGTVPIYREYSADAAKAQYYYSPRSAAAAAAAGWRQLDVAFYAYLASPYLLARSQLMETWTGDTAQSTPGYRIAISCRGMDGQPIQGALTLRATAPATLHLSDGSQIEVGPGRPITRSTSTDGQLSFVLETGGQLLAPVIKVRADFMGGTQMVAIAPDQNAHRDLASADLSALNQCGDLVKQVFGVLATSAPPAITATMAAPPLSFPPTALTWEDFGRAAEGAAQTVGQALTDFGHDVASTFTDAATTVGQAMQPALHAVEQAARTVVTSLSAGVTSNLAPGSPVMVALQGTANQVQAIVSRGDAAAKSVIGQISAGVRVALSATTTFINEAGTRGERLFNAFLVDVGTGTSLLITSAYEAQQLIVTLAQQAGKAIKDLLDLVTSCFKWDDILTTHNGINKLFDFSLDLARQALPSVLNQGKDAIVTPIGAMSRNFDAASAAWLNDLTAPLAQLQPPQLDSMTEYLQSLVQRSLQKVSSSLGLPAALDTSGVASALSQSVSALPSSITALLDPQNPTAILTGGAKAILQALRSTIMTMLQGTADFVNVQFESLKALILSALDLVRTILDMPLPIPVLGPLYEQKTNGQKLTFSRLLSLIAAVPLNVAWHAATGGPPDLAGALSQLSNAGPLSFADSGEDPLKSAYWPVSATVHFVLSIGHGLLINSYLSEETEPGLECFLSWVEWLLHCVKAYCQHRFAIHSDEIVNLEAELVGFEVVLPVLATVAWKSPDWRVRDSCPKLRAMVGSAAFGYKMYIWSVKNAEPHANRDESARVGAIDIIEELIFLVSAGDTASRRTMTSRVLGTYCNMGLVGADFALAVLEIEHAKGKAE